MTDKRQAADHAKVGRSFGIVGIATMTSRVTGLLRDIATAYFFGTSLAASAFVIAFRLPNLFRRLLGEGALTAAFVPTFTEHIEKDGKTSAWQMVNIVASVLSVVLVGLVGVAVIAVSVALWLFPMSDQWKLTLQLTQVMFPYLILVCLAALSMGVLNSLHRFGIPALSPVLLNLSMVASVFLICPWFGTSPSKMIFGLAIGVLLGGAGQLVMQLPQMWKEGFRPKFDFQPRHPFVKQIATLMGPGIFGVAVFQINVTIDSVLAMWLDPSSPAILYYADRLMELPLGVFSISVATAILPMLSVYAARNEVQHMKDLLNYGLRMVFFICIPATVGLIVLAKPIVLLLFERKFATAGFFNVDATVFALVCFAIGLCSFSFVNVLARFFYALKDTKTPVKIAAGSLVVNVVASVSLMWWLREGGLALAASLGSTFNAGMLLWLLRKRVGLLGVKLLMKSGIRICVATAVMAVACVLTLNGAHAVFPQDNIVDKLLRVALSLLAGIGVYFAAARMMRLREFGELIALTRLGKQGSAV